MNSRMFSESFPHCSLDVRILIQRPLAPILKSKKVRHSTPNLKVISYFNNPIQPI